MKKFLFLILSLSVLFCCNKNTSFQANNTVVKKDTVSFENDKLTSILKKYDRIMFDFGDNKLKEAELNSKRLTELANLMDSIGIFNNLEGVISDIELQENGKLLKFKIGIWDEDVFLNDEDTAEVTPPYITLYCEHIVESDSDYLLNKIKDIPTGYVFFDGVITISAETGLPAKYKYPYYTESDHDFYNHNYYFDVIDINVKPLKKISNSLRNALIDARVATNSLYKGYRDGKSNKADINKTITKYKESISKLSSDDKAYAERNLTCLIYGIWR